MVTVSGIVKQLKKERDRGSSKPTRKRGKMSAAGRARIAAAQRKRWAKIKAKKKSR
jgi:hypothetical protein